MPQIRNDELGRVIRPAWDRMLNEIKSDNGISDSDAVNILVERIADATSGGATSGGGDVLEPSTVLQVLSGDIQNPSINMLEGFSEVLGISMERLSPLPDQDK
jgi:hypothetical protein